MIIAVDFDGCLCENAWPGIGAAHGEVILYLRSRKARGDRIILWTCRTGKRLADAVVWCAQWGLVFDAVNENLPEMVQGFGNDCRKVYADEYWDDKSVIVGKDCVCYLNRGGAADMKVVGRFRRPPYRFWRCGDIWKDIGKDRRWSGRSGMRRG